MESFRHRVSAPPAQRGRVGSGHFDHLMESAFNPHEKRAKEREAAARARQESRSHDAAASREAAESRAREEAAARDAAAAREAAATEAKERAAAGSGRRRVPTVRFRPREGYAKQVQAEAQREGGSASLRLEVSREKLMRTNMPLGFGAPGEAARAGRFHTSSLASAPAPEAPPAEASSSRQVLMASHVRMGTDRVEYSTSNQEEYREPGESAVREVSGSRNALMATTMVLGKDQVRYQSSSASEFVPKGNATREACTDRTKLLATSMVVGTDEVDYCSAHARDYMPHDGGSAKRGAVSDRNELLNSALRLGCDKSSWETETKRSFSAKAGEGKSAPSGSRVKLMRTSVRLGSGPSHYVTTATSEFQRSSDYLRGRGEAARRAAQKVGPPVVAEYVYEDVEGA